MQRFLFPIQISSVHKHGHLLFKAAHGKSTYKDTCDTLIVGAGISGLSAAYALQDRKVILCDIHQAAGGNSSSQLIQGGLFSTGAHYDESYPDYFGATVLQVLQELHIIHRQNNRWEFKDKQYLIPAKKTQRCFVNNGFRTKVHTSSRALAHFESTLEKYYGHMPLPSRLVSKQYRDLNTISFYEFLKKNQISPTMFSGIHHQMRDDYGADAFEVSALAGVHYYTNRHFKDSELDIFSPPQGNAYFANKFVNALANDTIRTSSLVRSVAQTRSGYETTVLDLQANIQYQIASRDIIYAGFKPALSQIYPKAHRFFAKAEYAPWLVIQFVTEDLSEPAFWQNELLVDDVKTPFMGFVDSAAQAEIPDAPRVLTAFFNLEKIQRSTLIDIENTYHYFVADALFAFELIFQKPMQAHITKALLHVHGHGMPIPKPGHLFADGNSTDVARQGFCFAGTDNGRLPLFLDALDSGLCAANSIKKLKSTKLRPTTQSS